MFFFFNQKTAYEMRISDWSSDVCSSDLVTLRPIDRADRAALLEAFADGLENSFATIVPGEATIDGWFDQIERDSAAGRVMAFTVLDSAGRVSGTTRFLRMAEEHRRLEIGGTVYARRVQRTGLNTDAQRPLLTHAFEALGCQCVQFRTDTRSEEHTS